MHVRGVDGEGHDARDDRNEGGGGSKVLHVEDRLM